MKSIGEKIKELRNRNDMTQEQLAAYLNITFQTVSKWETNVSSPDLSLIIPLTKVFHISADELLGINDVETDKRYEELKKEYDDTFKTDDFAKRQAICESAVSEYPGDMVWLNNLAWVISNRAFEYQDNDIYIAEQEKAIRLFDAVIKNCKDDYIKGNAILGITQLLGWRGRKDEAKKYAELLPEKSMITRDSVWENTLEGDEQILFKQKRMMSHIRDFLWDLHLMPEIYTRVTRNILYALFPDENYLGFNDILYFDVKKEVNFILKQNSDTDIETVCDLLSEMRKYAKEHDRIAYLRPGIYKYTAPWFDHIEEDTRKWFSSEGTTLTQDLHIYLEDPKFNRYRDNGLFKSIQ